MTLDEIYKHGQEAAETIFQAQGEVRPMYICETRDDQILPIIVDIPGRDEKPQFVAAMKRLFKEKGVVRFCSLMEGWMVTAKNIPESIRRGASVQSHPDHREVLGITAEEGSQQRNGLFYILRPEHGKPTLSPFEHIGEKNDGLFSGMLED